MMQLITPILNWLKNPKTFLKLSGGLAATLLSYFIFSIWLIGPILCPLVNMMALLWLMQQSKTQCTPTSSWVFSNEEKLAVVLCSFLLLLLSSMAPPLIPLLISINGIILGYCYTEDALSLPPAASTTAFSFSSLLNELRENIGRLFQCRGYEEAEQACLDTASVGLLRLQQLIHNVIPAPYQEPATEERSLPTYYHYFKQKLDEKFNFNRMSTAASASSATATTGRGSHPSPGAI